MACLILKSCTVGNTTVLVTLPAASATLIPYIGQHVSIIGHPGVCFSVEQTENACVDCIKEASILPIAGNPICQCDIPFIAYILTPCPGLGLPVVYATQNLYSYVGTNITFFGQGGACYTVTGSLTIPPKIVPVILECIIACDCVMSPCGCPDGFTLDSNGNCIGIVNVPPIVNNTQYPVVQADWNPPYFAILAAEFYEDITNKPWPILSAAPAFVSTYTDNTLVPLLITNTLANQIWGGFTSSVNYRMRIAGVWTGLGGAPFNQWIGFSFCITLTETKTYYIAYAVDDFARILIDGALMLNQNTSGWAFKKLQIFPLTLNAGLHIFTGEVNNAGSSALFAFEIYNATLSQLLAVTNPGDIDPYLIFSSGSQIGINWQTGESSGYTCPDGYALNTCDGLVCTQIITVPQVICDAWQITFCDGTNVNPIITSTDLTQYIGGVYTITYIIPSEPFPIVITVCGTVEKAPAQVATAFDGIFSEIIYDCCKSCMAICYLLTDCQNAVPSMILCTDLSTHVGKIIKIKGCGGICWHVAISNTCVGSIKFDGEITEFETCQACLPPIPIPVPFELNLRKVKPGYNSPNSCITLDYLQRINCNFAQQVYNEMLIKRYGITVCCDQNIDVWDIQKSELDYMSMGDPFMCKSTICNCKAPCLIDITFELVPTCIAPILIDTILDISCYPPIFVDASIDIELTPIPCECYILTGSNYTIGWIDCCCEYKTETFTSNATVCAHYSPIILNGSVTINYGKECGSISCVAAPPICYCWDIVVNAANEEITYIGCNDIEVVISAILNDQFSVCSRTMPTFANNSTITNIGFCTGTCGTAKNCTCYEVIITSSDVNPATVDVKTSSCVDHTIVINTVMSGIPLFICSSKIPVIISASPNAHINVIVNSNTGCANCHAPQPCICYEVLMPAPFGGIINYVNCSGININAQVGAGWSYHCSQSGPPTPVSGGAPLIIQIKAADCLSGECIPTGPCTVPGLSCWLVTNPGGPVVGLFSDCFSSYVLHNMIGSIQVCNDVAPIGFAGCIITQVGPCDSSCVSTPASCQCYRIVMPNATPGNFSYIDCAGLPATTIIINSGTICAKTLPKVTNAIVGGQIDITYSTDICSLGQCI